VKNRRIARIAAAAFLAGISISGKRVQERSIARFIATVTGGLLLLPSMVSAQDLEPRTYTNIPVGQNFLGAGYIYSKGDLNPSASAPFTDAKLTADGPAVAYVRSLDLAGKAGKLDLSWARLCFDGSATATSGEKVEGDRCGTADPAVRLSYLFYGAPALTMQEFRQQPARRVIGASLAVRAPWGDYNNDNLINSGTNRWSVKPEIGISNVYGNWSVESSLAVSLYTDNDRFAGHRKLEQDPLYQVQAHLIYALPGQRWISLNGNYFWGGESQVNGKSSNDRQRNSRLGITYSTPLTASQSVKFYASRGVVTRVGNDFDTFGVVWQYRWADE